MRDPWRERLSEFLDHELLPEEEAKCRLHLASCDSCREDLAELKHIKQWAAEHRPKPPVCDPWPEIKQRIEGLQAVSLCGR